MPLRRLRVLLLCVLSCLCTAFGPPRLTDSDIARRGMTLQQIRALRQLPVPQISAASAILASTTTGQILYARNEHERRAPASLVKILTAIVALQRGRLDQQIRIEREDLRAYSVVGLQNGQELSLRDLLFVLLVPSDNAASMAIGRGLADDVQTFVKWMNELASSWGLTNTRVANPHGLDHKDSYSTAYDMAIIARQAMTDPLFADIIRRSEVVVAGHWMESTNELLDTYSGMTGVKTGTTDLAGECFIATVDRPSGQVLSVIMGSEDRFRDTRLLLDHFYSTFAELRVDLPEIPQNRYLDEDANWRAFGLREPVTFLISPWQVGTESFYRRIDDISADPSPDEPIGALVVMLAGRRLTEVPLYVR